jgi:phage protein D
VSTVGLVSDVEVRVGGSPLAPDLAASIVEVRVRDNLMLPDEFLVRLSDPGLEHIDSNPLTIGAEVEILFAGEKDARSVSVLKGQVTALEPEFGKQGVILVARGYDHSHALNRARTSDTYQNMTPGDIARKVIGRAGLEAGTIEDGGDPYEFVQQSDQTDWDFLWALASDLDFEVVADGRTIHFRKAGGPGGSPVSVRWGEDLLGFRPRVTGIQQVEEVVVRSWNEKAKQRVEARAATPAPATSIGISRSSIVGAMGGGTVQVGDRPGAVAGHADLLAQALASRLANAFLEAEGSAKGNPAIRAGVTLQVDGLGASWNGSYALSATTHLMRAGRGYETHFTIGGRTPRSLIDLATPASRRAWGSSLVIGVVTQNDDPDGLGRVRVQYPSLGDATEGWWARVVSPSAGKDRGLLMMPIVGDEVVVAFEHGDVRRPYVLGSLWNGKGTPGDLVQKDGSFALQSDKLVNVVSTGKITVKGKDALEITTDGDNTQKPQGALTLQAGKEVTEKAGTTMSLESGQSLSIKGGTSVTIEGGTDLTIKAPSVTVQASGVVKVSGSQVMLG